MRITSELTDEATLQEMGARLERQRIEANLTQAALAEQAGVAKRTVERIEHGHSADSATLIRLLRALKLTDGLESLIPELPPSPIALMKLRGRQRRRVHSRPTESLTAPMRAWTWKE